MPFEMKNKGSKEGEIRIFGPIGNYKMFDEDTTPTDFQRQLDNLGDIELLNVSINSPGGGIYAGITIGNILKNHPALVNTCVYGMCASIATVILQAGDERTIVKNGSMYLHNPMGGAWGYAKDLIKYAEELNKAKDPIMKSFDRIKVSESRLSQLMDEETTLSANEALKLGFVDKIVQSKVKAAVKSNIVTFDDVSFDKMIFGNYDTSKIDQWDGSEPDPIPDNAPDNSWAKDMENRFHLLNAMQSEINMFEIGNFSSTKGGRV